MRPTKFLLLVDTHRSPFARIPMCPPRQGPQVGVQTTAPASTKVSIKPRRRASAKISLEAGITMQRTEGWTSLPRRTRAACSRSDKRPLVQDPMNTWSTGMGPTSRAGRTLAGEWGSATRGVIPDTSTTTSFS